MPRKPHPHVVRRSFWVALTPLWCLSSVIDNQFPHVQAADAKFVDLDDPEAGAADRQAADDQAADRERAQRDSANGERPDCQAADRLGANTLLHLAFVRVKRGGCP